MVSAIGQLAALPVPVLAVVIGVCLFVYRSHVRTYLRDMAGGGRADNVAAGCIFSVGIFLMSLMFVTAGLVFTVLVVIQTLK